MQTDEITKAAEKILAGFTNISAEMSPVINHMLEKISKQNVAFDLKKHEIEKEISRGAKTTRHRLHL